MPFQAIGMLFRSSGTAILPISMHPQDIVFKDPTASELPPISLVQEMGGSSFSTVGSGLRWKSWTKTKVPYTRVEVAGDCSIEECMAHYLSRSDALLRAASAEDIVALVRAAVWQGLSDFNGEITMRHGRGESVQCSAFSTYVVWNPPVAVSDDL